MRILIIIFFLISNFASYSRYFPDPLWQMIDQADKIVYGTIEQVQPMDFVVKIEGGLNTTPRKIKIKKYRDFACSYRWEEYKVGQKVFLFLEKEKRSFRIMNGGGEGEMPMINDTIYIDGRVLNYGNDQNLPKDKSWEVQISSRPYFGLKMSVQEFIHCIKTFKECIQLKVNKNYKYSMLTLCDNPSLENERKLYPLFNWLIADLLKHTA